MEPWHVLVIVFAVASLAEGILIVGMMRQIGGIYLQVGPPRPGQTAGYGPAVGDTIDPARLDLTRPTILFFLSPTCSLCPVVANAIPIAAAHFGALDFVPGVIGPDTEAKLAYAASLGPKARTDLDHLFEEWNVAGTPFAIGFAPDGTVRASGIVNSLPQIESLAETLVSPVRQMEHGGEAARELKEAIS